MPGRPMTAYSVIPKELYSKETLMKRVVRKAEEHALAMPEKRKKPGKKTARKNARPG